MTEKKRIVLTVTLCVLFAVAVLGGFMHKLTKPRVLSDRELRTYGALLLDTPRLFSDFNLTDHRGQPFTKNNLADKWTLMFFGFGHCPDICPTTLATLAKVYAPLTEEEKARLQVVMVTVDPERDTVETLAQYVPYFHKDFIGVTGTPFQLLDLTTKLGVVYAKVPLGDNDYTMDHSGNVVIINPRGDYHGFFRPPFEEGSLRVAWRSMDYTFSH